MDFRQSRQLTLYSHLLKNDELQDADRPLALSLLVPWIIADDEYDATATDDLAFIADTLDARANFHHQPRTTHRASQGSGYNREPRSIGGPRVAPQGGRTQSGKFRIPGRKPAVNRMLIRPEQRPTRPRGEPM